MISVAKNTDNSSDEPKNADNFLFFSDFFIVIRIFLRIFAANLP